MKSAREQPIQSVADSRQDEDSQGQQKFLVEEKRNKNRNQRHPKDGQEIWQRDDSRGHFAILRSKLRLRTDVGSAVSQTIHSLPLTQAAKFQQRNFGRTAIANRQYYRPQAARDVDLRVRAP